MNYILIFILLMYIPKQLPFCDLRDAQLDMCAEIYTSIANTSVNTKFAYHVPINKLYLSRVQVVQ